MRKQAVLLLLACCLLAFSACGSRKAPADEGLQVVVSAFPEYSLAKAVGGDLVEVTLLLKPGMEAHSYEPTPQDILAIRGAKLFIYGGGESDVWADRLLASGDLGDTKVLALMDHALLRREETQEYMTVEEAGEEGDEYDEHVWTSPKNMILLTEAVRDALTELDPANAEDYKMLSDGYIGQLEALDGRLRELAETSKRKLLVFGDRFPFLYLVREYGLEYAAAFPGCSGETDANPATVAHLIDTVREAGIPVVFKCDLSAGKLADTIAEAAGAKVLTLYSVHTVSKDDFDAGTGYLALMEKNPEALREALN
jgi:zinc transport system substrate-binding protein